MLNSIHPENLNTVQHPEKLITSADKLSSQVLLQHLSGETVLKGNPTEFPHSLDFGMFEADIRTRTTRA